MKTMREKTLRLTRLGIFTAIIAAMTFIPWFGYIPTPFGISATIMHIPVIIGAIMLGTIDGAILGGVWGVFCIIKAFAMPTSPTDYLFINPLISLLPRICVGIVAALLYKLLIRVDKTKLFASAIAALAASLTNTILVLTMLYFTSGEIYAEILGMAFEALLPAILTVVATAGILESVIAAIITAPIVKALNVYRNKSQNKNFQI